MIGRRDLQHSHPQWYLVPVQSCSGRCIKPNLKILYLVLWYKIEATNCRLLSAAIDFLKQKFWTGKLSLNRWH